ncbi:MAG: ferredoxin [bacterium]|nr:ferredoxin [bacterium]
MRRRFEVVEEECIGCALCSERAPENLEIPAGTSIARVFKQPQTPAEEEACAEASDYCPIGGLQANAADSPSADSSQGDAQGTLIPAGDSTPVGITSATLEK